MKYTELPEEIKVAAKRVSERLSDVKSKDIDMDQIMGIIKLILMIIEWFQSRNKTVSLKNLNFLQRLQLRWLTFRSKVKAKSNKDALEATVAEITSSVVESYKTHNLSGKLEITKG